MKEVPRSKLCPKCGLTKTRDQFYTYMSIYAKRSTKPRRRISWECKECHNSWSRGYYKQRYREDRAFRESERKRTRASYEKHREARLVKQREYDRRIRAAEQEDRLAVVDLPEGFHAGRGFHASDPRATELHRLRKEHGAHDC